MYTLLLAVLSLLTITCEGNVSGLWSTETTGHWGTWGNKDICPSHRYARGFRMKSEKNQGAHRDDTGLTGVELYCRGGGTVKSSVSEFGDWLSESFCGGENNPVVGFRIKIEKKGGFWKDDTGANRIELLCGNGEKLLGEAYTDWGKWSAWHKCPKGKVVVGIQTRVEKSRGAHRDDSGLNGVSLLCRDEPVDGGWSLWSEFSKCSKECGNGIQKRIRTCTKPSPQWDGKLCEGKSGENRRCKVKECPVPYREVDSDRCLSVSHDDCKKIAVERGTKMTEIVNTERDFPPGCYEKKRTGGRPPLMYFNHKLQSKKKCDGKRICVCTIDVHDEWEDEKFFDEMKSEMNSLFI